MPFQREHRGVVAMMDGSARTRSVRRLAVAAWLRNLALVCLGLALVGAAIDYFGPASPRPVGWFTGADLNPNLSERIGGVALVLVMLTLALGVAVGVIRLYDAWARDREAGAR